MKSAVGRRARRGRARKKVQWEIFLFLSPLSLLTGAGLVIANCQQMVNSAHLIGPYAVAAATGRAGFRLSTRQFDSDGQ